MTALYIYNSPFLEFCIEFGTPQTMKMRLSLKRELNAQKVEGYQTREDFRGVLDFAPKIAREILGVF